MTIQEKSSAFKKSISPYCFGFFFAINYHDDALKSIIGVYPKVYPMKINVILGTPLQSFGDTMPVFFCARPVFMGIRSIFLGTPYTFGACLVIERGHQ
ncbi:hypothetical protein A3X38_24325 [Salmonella enterica subsp. enterica serovar Florida]|nr:hypothetical protein [Salmonella enterica subsp. enterica serovar Florida]